MHDVISYDVIAYMHMMSFHMMSLHMCTLISDVQAVWCVKFSMISLCPYPPFLLDSTIISQYPTSSEYPRFYELGGLLRGMVEDSLKIHPYTREMLAALDRCVTTSSYRHLTVKLHTTPFSEQPSIFPALHLFSSLCLPSLPFCSLPPFSLFLLPSSSSLFLSSLSPNPSFFPLPLPPLLQLAERTAHGTRSHQHAVCPQS